MAIPSLSGLTGGLTGGNALGTLYVRLAADSSQLVSGVSSAQGAIIKGSLAIVGALAAIGTAAVVEFAKFDKAMTNAFSIMGNLSDGMKKQMSETARALAKDSVKSAEDLAKSYFFLASAGFDAEQAMKALPLLTKFATAGNFEMARATDLLADSQSALGLRSKDATKNLENMARVADVITKANILSNASVEQFSEALTNKAAAALRNVNKDVEEGAAVLAVYADQGLKGAGAGEALNIVLRDLQTTAIENRKVFDQLGIQVFDSEGKMKNMADIVGQFETALKGASTEQQRMVFQLAGFQDRSLSALISLLGMSEKIRAYEKDLRSAGGVTEEVANKQLTSFSSQIEISVNRLKDLLITIGENLRPALDELNGMLQALTSTNSAQNESFKETIRIVGTVLVGAVKGAIMIWEGWRDLMKVVAMAMLKVAELQLQTWLPMFKILEMAFQGFVQMVEVGVNLMIAEVNRLTAALPTKVQEMLGITQIKPFTVKFKLPIDTEQIQEWISILKMAREEIDAGLVKTVMGAAQSVEPAVEIINTSFENMAVVVGGKIEEVATHVNKVKQMLDSMEVTKALDKMGLPEKKFLGSDPFIGQSESNAKEMEEAASRLAMLEEMGRKELELTEDVQKRRMEVVLAYQKRLKELQLAEAQVILQSSQQAFDELGNAARAFAGEQSDIYKAMFAASKAFAIAEAIVKIQQGIASAAALPWPTNLAAIASVVAATASIVSTIASVKLTLDGKKAAGGGVRGGGNYLVGERGPEIFSPSSNGNIIPNNRLGGDVKVVINNFTDAQATVTERRDGDQKVIEVMVKRIKNEMASEIRDGRGDLSRAMEGSYGLQRGRGPAGPR